MRRKMDHPVVGQRRPLHRRLAGVAAKVDVAGRGTELAGTALSSSAVSRSDGR
jgi:hypothetical protein